MQNPREGSAWISRLTLQSTDILSCLLLLTTQLLSPGHPSPSENQSWLGFSVPAPSSWPRSSGECHVGLPESSLPRTQNELPNLTLEDWLHFRWNYSAKGQITGKGPTSLTIHCLFFRISPREVCVGWTDEQALTRRWKWHHWLENTALSKGIILKEQQKRAWECLPQWGLSVHHHFCQTWVGLWGSTVTQHP